MAYSSPSSFSSVNPSNVASSWFNPNLVHRWTFPTKRCRQTVLDSLPSPTVPSNHLKIEPNQNKITTQLESKCNPIGGVELHSPCTAVTEDADERITASSRHRNTHSSSSFGLSRNTTSRRETTTKRYDTPSPWHVVIRRQDENLGLFLPITTNLDDGDHLPPSWPLSFFSLFEKISHLSLYSLLGEIGWRETLSNIFNFVPVSADTVEILGIGHKVGTDT